MLHCEKNIKMGNVGVEDLQISKWIFAYSPLYITGFPSSLSRLANSRKSSIKSSDIRDWLNTKLKMGIGKDYQFSHL